MNKEFISKIILYGKDILTHPNFISQKDYIQHHNTSVYNHCICVAYNSLKINKYSLFKADERSLVRASLLHDYFLYDWHVKDKSHHLHGFIHAKKALINAKKDFTLTKREENAILRHMFPLNPIPPKYKESIIVYLADNHSSIKELFSKNYSSNITKEIENELNV